MQKTLFCFSLLLFEFISFGQQPRLDWAISAGDSEHDLGRCVVTDLAGNIYVTGQYRGTADFDPSSGSSFNLTSNGLSDVFVQKLDPNGNFIWAKSMGGPDDDISFSLAIDGNGNVLATGYFGGTADFDPGPGVYDLITMGNFDSFVCKLSSAGNFIWAKSFGGTTFDRGHGITTDAVGNVYSTGYYVGAVDFDPSGVNFTMVGNGLQDIYVHKLDPNGLFLWVKSFGSSGADYGKSIEIDPAGYLYVTGKYEGTVDFNPSGTPAIEASSGMEDGFIMKLDLNGAHVWNKSIGGSGDDYFRDVHLDGAGFLYGTGFYSSTADLDPSSGDFSLISQGGKDVFIEKMDTDGNFIWAKGFGGIGDDIGFSIVADADSGVYSCGFFNETVDFDPSAGINTIVGEGLDDGYIIRLNKNGAFSWVGTAGASLVDRAESITFQGDAIYCTGGFYETVDFDPNASSTSLVSLGLSDIFTLRLHQCFKDFEVDSINSCGPITWIDGNVYSTSNSTATYILQNIGGCDSVVMLDLTIPILDLTILEQNNSLISNSVGAAYQWLVCDSMGVGTVIQNATSSSFSPTQTGDYSVIISVDGCIDTSNCISYFEQSANAFSPNDDGVNDTFIMDIVNPNNVVIFYNRWGDVVRQIDGYNDMDKVWDGTSRFGESGFGTYYFVVEFTDSDEHYSGWVQLLE